MCNPKIKFVGITNRKSQRSLTIWPTLCGKVATFIYFLGSLDSDDDQELEMNRQQTIVVPQVPTRLASSL